tara:strand:+ start:253 stop:663 length:411 start_codon:yes stop_codon:yes gene_type:complete
MKHLVQLTIDYYNGNTETMVVTKESNAYMTMLEYAKQNDYAIDEKPYYDEKLMLWALRGILSTNRWEEIDILVDEYEIVKQTLRSDNLDAHESHGLDIDPTPSDSEIKDALFCNIDASIEDYRNQVWQAIMENINA